MGKCPAVPLALGEVGGARRRSRLARKSAIVAPLGPLLLLYLDRGGVLGDAPRPREVGVADGNGTRIGAVVRPRVALEGEDAR